MAIPSDTAPDSEEPTLDDYERALQMYRASGDREGEAETLNNQWCGLEGWQKSR